MAGTKTAIYSQGIKKTLPAHHVLGGVFYFKRLQPVTGGAKGDLKMKMENIMAFMNTSRAACAAYGDNGKADRHRNRRGREWSNVRVKELEKLNKVEPVLIYRLDDIR